MKRLLALADSGKMPDALIRRGIRYLNRRRLAREGRGSAEARLERKMALIRRLRHSPIAVATDDANRQHYELPTAFFETVLGPRMKYSGAFWPPGTQNLAQAEANMLALTCRRAGLRDGMQILDLGCGWGSLSLWIAGHYPRARITAVSNSATQKTQIQRRCRQLGISSINVVQADMNRFDTETRYERILSLEMFEHMRNWSKLLAKAARWLTPDGKLFLHVFAHRRLAYLFETAGDDNWMGRHFFTGGLMPSDDLLLYFQDTLTVERHWRVDGRHYGKTAEAWLDNMDSHRADLMPILAAVYGSGQPALWFQRWRIFFMACAELFNTAGGSEWLVSHYRLRRKETRHRDDGD
jgi:cyclopropane-fatty-acyl-phospholipid synthase